MEDGDKDGDIENAQIATNLKHFVHKKVNNIFFYF